MGTDAVGCGAAKQAVRAVLKDVIANNPAPSTVRGTALYDPQKDAIIQASSSFNAAKATIVDVPNFVGKFGSEEAERIVLQLIYQYFKRTPSVQYDETQLKQPDNLILTDLYNPSLKATRAIRALRLLAPGSIGIGPMWLTRAARFNPGIGGLSSTGTSIPMFGSPYHWTDEVQRSYLALYDALAHLEKEGYGKSPGNLQIALRSFVSSYDRWPAFPNSRLLDLITSLEALLGSETEIAFRLSFRVAALIAPDDRRRGELLKLIKGFYDTKAELCTGARLAKSTKIASRTLRRLRKSHAVCCVHLSGSQSHRRVVTRDHFGKRSLTQRSSTLRSAKSFAKR